MSIYKPFKPTFLYIKQHTITGKLYFGKTIKNPEKYLGSGSYWCKHIKKHGKEHVVNLWYCLFYEEQDCKEFALNFSNQNNIVESIDWLNLMEENGIGCTSHSQETIEKIKNSKHNNGYKHSTITKLKIGKALSKPWSIARRLSQKQINRVSQPKPPKPKTARALKRKKTLCPHCNKLVDNGNYARYHGDKCKHLLIYQLVQYIL